MQQCRIPLRNVPPCEFQYPQADRRGCNYCPSVLSTRLLQVSVSTSGSKGVQRLLQVLLYVIPRVSVSTSGSKGVQRMIAVARHSEKFCFSIHKRIEGGATNLSLSNSSIASTFQYPQADRRGCNSNTIDFIYEDPKFQYPQADRRGCNFRKGR